METSKASVLKTAVRKGMANGWTAKETATRLNFDVQDIRKMAVRMKVSFKWERIGIPPSYSSEPIPLSTLLKRHRTTLAEACAYLQKTLNKVGHDHEVSADLIKTLSYLRNRSMPASWERRLSVVRTDDEV